MKTILVLSVLLCLLFLPECTMSIPFGGPGWKGSQTEKSYDQPLILVLTEGHLGGTSQEKKDFTKHILPIADQLKSQAGLVGFSMKRQLFAKKVWTMTVWENKDSLKAFMEGGLHPTAKREGSSATHFFRMVIQPIPASDLPLTWKKAQDLLDLEKPLIDHEDA